MIKTTVRAFALVLAVSGAAAGVASSHASRTDQVATLSHQVILAGMPAPACGPQTCNIRGGK
jgi:hypothetical protein